MIRTAQGVEVTLLSPGDRKGWVDVGMRVGTRRDIYVMYAEDLVCDTRDEQIELDNMASEGGNDE